MPVHTDTPFRPLPFMARDIELQRRDDGTLLLSSRLPQAVGEPHLPGVLRRQAAVRPDAVWLAQRRGPHRGWRPLRYGEALQQVDAVTQTLLDLDKPGRCVVVLSGNGIEHGVLQLAAMQARMPHVPITPAYSLLTEDLHKLQSMIDLLQPAVVFAQDGSAFDRALRGLVLPADAVRLVADRAPHDLPVQAWADWLRTLPTADVAASAAAIRGDTVAKYLFTSGSTGVPKAATITQHMLMTSVAMHLQVLDEAPGTMPATSLDWMPWSHIASGNIIFGTTLVEGGQVWIDDGKPTPAQFEQTLANLREISPTTYSSVPLGYTMLVQAMEADDVLARSFFARLRRLNYAGAKLPDSVFDRMQALAVRTIGQRIPFVSAFGSTETAAAVTVTHWCADSAGVVGLPHPGVTLKLLPLPDERYEVRVKGDIVTPGYLRQPEASAQALDDEGFFIMGDALKFADPAEPRDGLVFAGRVTEDFKLQSGIFVRVGELRVACIEAAHGLLTDVVVAGENQPFVAVLAWPNVAACRVRAGTPDATAAELATAPWLRQALQQALAAHNQAVGGNSRRIQRLLLLAESPDMGAGEITDKGYINQRRVLSRRTADVARLFELTPGPGVIVVPAA